jgi:hypothetical protein
VGATLKEVVRCALPGGQFIDGKVTAPDAEPPIKQGDYAPKPCVVITLRETFEPLASTKGGSLAVQNTPVDIR